MDKTENKEIEIENTMLEMENSKNQELRNKYERPFYLNDREYELLEFVHDMKFASIHELYRKFFYKTREGLLSKSNWYARERVQNLSRNGYLKVGRKDEKGINLYIITGKALAALRTKYQSKVFGHLQKNIDIRCFEHDKLVLKTRMYLENQNNSLKWVSDKRLKSHPTIQNLIGRDYLPDGLNVDDKNTTWAIEIEISPKARWIYQNKIRRYVDLIRSNKKTNEFDQLIDKVLYICVRPKVYDFLKSECEIFDDLIKVRTVNEFFGIKALAGES